MMCAKCYIEALWRFGRLKKCFLHENTRVSGGVKHSFTAKHSGVGGVKIFVFVPAPYEKECAGKEHSRATRLKVDKGTNITRLPFLVGCNGKLVII